MRRPFILLLSVIFFIIVIYLYKDINSDGKFNFLITKNIELINVKNYGAIGDGITDDTIAIQKAIKEAKGKSLYFPRGSYLYSNDITFNCNVIGEGIGMSELVSENRYTSGETVYSIFFGSSNLIIKDMTFTRKSFISNNELAQLVNIVGKEEQLLENIKFIRCEFTQSTSFAFYASWVNDISFDDCLVHNTGADGLHFEDSTNITIKDSHFFNLGDDAIAFTSLNRSTVSKSILIENNYINQNKDMRGILLEGVNDVTIRDNIIYKTGKLGAIEISRVTNGLDSSDILIDKNNIIRDNQGGGLYIYGGTKNIKISNNIFKGGGNAIETNLSGFSAIDEVLFFNNLIKDVEQHALFIQDGSLNYIKMYKNNITSKSGGVYLGLNEEMIVTDNVIIYNLNNISGVFGITGTATGKQKFENNIVKKSPISGISVD